VTREAILLDTNVLSELMRPSPEPRVARFVASLNNPLVSAAVFHELAFGMSRLPDGARKARMAAEISSYRTRFEKRIVDIDANVAELSGRLRAAAELGGFKLLPMDALIAASAVRASARLATRNVKDFRPLGIDLVNPWTG
jgi:predicted nucleic acid-binding protein